MRSPLKQFIAEAKKLHKRRLKHNKEVNQSIKEIKQK